MRSEEIKQKILAMLRERDSVRVANLSRRFGVSEVTVRTYLQDLENKGLLSRTHGGAVSSYNPYCSISVTQRLETDHQQRVSIADRIVSLIKPNDTVMLNSGMTPLLVFRRLPAGYDLSIVTNSVSIALEASENPNCKVIFIGGYANTKNQFTYGSDALKQLRKYHADKLILSVDGIDMRRGLSTSYDEEAAIAEAMIERSDCRIVAADRSKFGRNAFTKIGELSVADYIITNDQLSPEFSKKLEELGIAVLL